MPDHSGVSGNCKADELARSFTPNSSDWELVGVPLASYILAQDLWTSCDQLCAIILLVQSGTESSELLALSNIHLTGHCLIGPHALRLHILSAAICQSCMNKGEFQIEVATAWQTHEPGKVTGIDYRYLNKYVAGSKHFVDLSISGDQYLEVWRCDPASSLI